MRLAFLFLSLFVNILSAQFTVTGKVTNQNGEPLILASVFLVNTPFAATTDDFGVFKLENIAAGEYEMKVTYLGYTSYDELLDLRADTSMNITLSGSKYNLEGVEIQANKLEKSSPFAYSELGRQEINIKNLGQDLPQLLEHQPSMVVTSDAGAGIGYTSMRIRGSDATRINVTVNGVPLNDSESHSVFWVNMPDFASSVNNIQVQRGVGPSTNGAAAFGGSVALNTQNVYQNAFINLSGSIGSFNTRKFSVSANTGLINEQYTIEGRYSKVMSDGYIDRASSDLSSYFFSVAKIGEKSSLRFNVISGSERTYQSWWGIPEAKLKNDDEALKAHYLNNLGSIYQTQADSLNLFDSDRRYNYYLYDNQVDDYDQNHYQFIFGQKINSRLSSNLTLHYTKGRGFFEEYRTNDDFINYGLGPFEDENGDPISSSDLVRRRWLDNHFYGAILNFNYEFKVPLTLLAGASINQYDGDHFGNVIWSERVVIQDPESNYYFSFSNKRDINAYAKFNYSWKDKLLFFGDLQVRSLSYQTEGTDNDLEAIDVDTSYQFFNPKFGMSYLCNNHHTIYFSAAMAQREPVRSDFIDARGVDVPNHESLWDFEIGHKYTSDGFNFTSNIYYMNYKNQLVLTGAVNDVGAPVRTNVDKSYRLGIEMIGSWVLSDIFNLSGNISLSRNKISAFDEIIANYDTGELVMNSFENSDISFSPQIIGGTILEFMPVKAISVQLLSKYVGRQYLDNTSNEAKSLDGYFLNDIVLTYRPQISGIQNAEIKLLVNNIMDVEYASNGYTYSYIYGGLIEENLLYPQAGINVLLGVNFSF